ncbi:MAG: hypothetical protein ACE5H4_09110 [Candidatus Thorarchaeota archaeon]
MSEPRYPSTDFTFWSTSSESLNVSVYSGVTGTYQNGFWRIQGHSANIVQELQMWTGTSWSPSYIYRANDNVRFRAQLDTSFNGATVTFVVRDPTSAIWDTLTAQVVAGYAETSDVNLDAFTATVGEWTVQAYANDSISGGPVQNVGLYSRTFAVEHSTDMYVIYPRESVASWTRNLTYGQDMLLQLRVNDSDNGDLLPGGDATFNWTTGTEPLNDMGTGEYSTVLNTADLGVPGRYAIAIYWNRQNYDPISKVFVINVVEETTLQSPSAPGVTVPHGWNATLELFFADSSGSGIQDAILTCNWTDSPYYITPEVGEPGNYTLTITTYNSVLDTFAVLVKAQKDFYVTSQITLFVEVRQLFTSVSVSHSIFSLPIGYQESITLTYWDTDHDLPILGAESSIWTNWSDYHQFGDQNYTVAMVSPGVYEIVFFSIETDTIGTNAVRFEVTRFGYQNHTFEVTVDVSTHLTSFRLDNPVEPTPFTVDIAIQVTYFDESTSTGIVGPDVLIYATTPGISPFLYTVTNGSAQGSYVITIPANQWGDIGWKDLTLYANWTGPRSKFDNLTLDVSVRISGSPADLFIGQSPVSTPYGENINFTVVYWDVGNSTGIVNGTGPYAFNVTIRVDVLTPGQTLTQALMIITEVDYINRPGEYRIVFNTSHLSGLIGCELKIWFNWTRGAMPLYENRTLLLTVYSTYRQTVVDTTSLPVSPFDEKVNLTIAYKDVLTGANIQDSGSLSITTPGYAFNVIYDGDATALFFIEVDTLLFTSPGTYSFQVVVEWSGGPFYQNRTVDILITVRERYTSLTHGSYGQVQYGNNLTLVFTYTDLDDFTSVGMNGGTLTVPGLVGFYDITDNGDGTYTLELGTDAFPSVGTFVVNVSIVYGGTRHCADATDFFHLTVVERRTQLTSDPPDPAPFLTQANITVHYIDDNTASGIAGADVYATCATATEPLLLNTNYWVDDLGGGSYQIRMSTVALGNFGSYTIEVTANWTGTPFYMERARSVDIEVSRRPVGFTVSRSPLNTPFLENVTFEITISDSRDGTPITVDKSTLILSHNGGIAILNSEYSISGSNGVYLISINSTVLTPVLVTGHPIEVKFFWGDMVPYYANATTATQVNIGPRFTQGRVLSTPAAFYSFNLSAVIEYSDYLTGRPIPSASVTFLCLNDSSFWSDIIPLGDGSYKILVDTNDLSGIGRYYFMANFTWTGPPYYDNVYGLEFSVVVNPVSTSLNFVLLPGVTYYLGDIVVGNITFTDILEGRGIDGAIITSDWNSTYAPSIALITPLGNGIYRMSINTSGLDAQVYPFTVSAFKLLHLNRSITADVFLAAIPVEIELVFTPTNPEWGEPVELSANVTDARNGNPVLPTIADPEPVNLTISGTTYVMVHQGGGIYNITIPTAGFVAGEYTLRVRCALLNHESRQKDFQMRIYKVASKISASLDPQVAVNGQTVTVEADYLILSNNSPIGIGVVTYSWIGGFGNLTWVPAQQKYVASFMVSNAAVGNHQILIQATSSVYKSVSTPITIEITEITTSLTAYQGITVLSAVSGDTVNVTVYMNNTALGLPVTGASVAYSIPGAAGDLTEIGGGYYSADVSTGTLQVGEWILGVSGAAPGFTPSSTQFTITILKIPTIVEILGEALIGEYYGRNVTFLLRFHDIHNDVGISGATATYVLELTGGTLQEMGNGTYSLTVNTTWVSAGMHSHDISVTFQKNLYDYAYGTVKLVSMPIPTEVIGAVEADVPVGDDYTHVFQFNDTLHNELLDNATAIAFWDFAPVSLTPLGGGAYRFGPTEANLSSRLDVRTTPYRIRIQFSKANYSVEEITFMLTIREIRTELRVEPLPSAIYVQEVFYVQVTFWDLDHDVAIPGAFNSTTGLDNLPEFAEDYGDGTYLFAFLPPAVSSYELVITLSMMDYQDASEVLFIQAEFTPEAQTLMRSFMWGGILLILIAGLASAYVRVWSVPKLLRTLRRMVSMLRKGQIPAPADVRDRRAVILENMNEDLAPVGLSKEYEDVAPSTVEVEALDVERLLEELRVVIGLTEEDVTVLRHDLDRMRPSERAGFIGEVLRQERARRARELAEAELVAEEPEAVVEAERRLTEEELEHLREELIKMGIEPSEADLMVEQARSLTKAEIDALLDQIGGLKE